MRYDVRLPGFGGAGVFWKRAIAGEPASLPGVDVWLVAPGSCVGVLRRPVGPGFWERLARYLFAIAASAAPARDVPAFWDAASGLSIDVGTSDNERLGLRVLITEDTLIGTDDPGLDFESSRAVVANAAIEIRAMLPGVELVDFAEWAR